ncbi:hypothetical protein ElyMa_001200900 [Elysia marginata]|uniref:Endonuclease/exonuclease/phosphatase domain-containing protein n=1 Tax=Elysia marginata TaxID=1093978 RepID=A0AAV4I7J0_9GAST|nr:hypothetical protein ElyMa_001200900 [Elysia marginata]
MQIKPIDSSILTTNDKYTNVSASNAITITSLTSSLFTRCVPDRSQLQNRFNGPGLLLVSKHEILRAEYHDFFPDKMMIIQRGYIEAEIKDFGTVVCSHFSYLLDLSLEYDDTIGFKDYKEQQLAEIAIIDNKFGSRDHVIMADFNTGPRVETADSPDKVLVGEVPENYQVWLDHGYNTTYMTDDGRCTRCIENKLLDGQNNAVDFIMFKGNYIAGKEERVLDCYPPMSDHYGVRRTVCKRGE